MRENGIFLVPVKYTLVCLASTLAVFGCMTHDCPDKSKLAELRSLL